jgi:RNA polymerase subunit RPABC4/transcription elongation factor Spt4
MFLMIGLTNGRKKLPVSFPMICPNCGQYSRFEVWMTYTQLLLFFIPCFKWHKRYFVRMRCCGAVYELDPEIGRRMARGEEVSLTPGDLQGPVSTGGTGDVYRAPRHRCANCGYETDEDFEYCPKCGTPFRD